MRAAAKTLDTAPRNRHYRCLEYDHDQQGDICLIACGRERCDPGVCYGPDRRDGWHLHVILSGTGTLWAGGQELHPRFGQMFLLKDGETVAYAADASDPWEYCWVTYNGSEAKRLSEEIGFTDGVYCLDSAVEGKAFYELILRMHEKPEMNYTNDLRRRGILLEFLALEATAARGRKNANRYEYPARVYAEQAAKFIRYNYATIHVSDVVEYIGFTRSYFTTLFKREIGLSPQDYLMQVRLQKAGQQLAGTDLPVQAIAVQVGYDDPLTFSRSFRRAFGMSPSEYRRQQAGGGSEP